MKYFKNYYKKASCFSCRNKLGESAYQPLNSMYNCKVYVCENCTLVQTIRKEIKIKRTSSLSSDADWGNVRHAKKLRLDQQQLLINFKEYLKGNILDIGSNRGDFIKYAASFNKVKSVSAVEPDPNIIDYKGVPKVEIHQERFENFISHNDQKFDFIFCNHTLEHVDDPYLVLSQAKNVLKESGFVLIDVPNIEFISNQFIVEEFFIDKHKFHFSENSIEYLFNKSNFFVKEKFINNANMTYILTTKDTGYHYTKDELKDSTYYKTLLTKYEENLRNTRNKLSEIVKKNIEPFLLNNKVAIWGGGRILDSLIKYGDLKLSREELIVDSYLYNISGDIDKKPKEMEIKNPKELEEFKPDVLFILANSAEVEISKEAKKIGINKIICFSELF